MGKGFVLLLCLVLIIVSCLIAAKPVLSSAELVEDSWVSKASLPTARSDLGVAVVNGRIYAIGGMPDYSVNEEYDPATDTWTAKAAMPTARYRFGIAVYQNKIYCIGGQFSNRSGNARPEFTGAIEVYDPATDTWETKAPMPQPRSQFEANVVNGKIYIMGGRTGGQYSTVSLNEVYDPKTNSWTTKDPLLYPVVSYSSATIGNRIYVFGGQDEFNETMNLAVNQIYDTETDTWSLGAPLPTAVRQSAGGATSGVLAPQRIYVVGGDPSPGEQATNYVQVYNPLTDSWSYGAPMLTARLDLAMAVLDDRLYAIGGANHYFLLPGLDASAENAMYTPAGYHGAIDGTKPIVTVLSPENLTYNLSSVALVFSVNEQASWMGYSLDGEETLTVTGNTTLSRLPNGLHNVTVYAKDEFGNTGASETIYFTVAIPEPEPEPFPTIWVAAATVTVAVVGVGLLVYFRKRNH